MAIRSVGVHVRSQDIEIPEPCHADWDAMRPEQRGRYCFDCRKKVHDLSAMTGPQARDFLADNECEDICVSYQHEDDGTLIFREPVAQVVPVSRLRRPRRPAKVAAAIAGAGMAVALAACAPHGQPLSIQEAETVSMPLTVVIPHEAGTKTPPPPTTEDEPCDGPEATPEEYPRVRGRMKPRTAGKPVRKMGKKAAPRELPEL